MRDQLKRFIELTKEAAMLVPQLAVTHEARMEHDGRLAHRCKR